MTPTFFDVGWRRNWRRRWRRCEATSLKREGSIEISRPAVPRAGSHIIRPSPSPFEEGAENGQNRVWMADDEKTGTTSHLTFQYFQFPWTPLARMVMAIFRVLTISRGPQNLVDLSSVGEGSWNKNTQRPSENTSADWHRFDKTVSSCTKSLDALFGIVGSTSYYDGAWHPKYLVLRAYRL